MKASDVGWGRKSTNVVRNSQTKFLKSFARIVKALA